ncbi:hypothetical protein CY35_13G064700 [Sphagnum magellanicum]|nr:hypothetical protein CY35_13G064700 [Sphagnum magellanicum]
MGSVKEQARSCGLWVVVIWALVVVVVVVAGAGSVVAARQIAQPELITQVTEAKEERRGGLLVDDVHLIESLPGGPPVSFSMRSGYITVDEKAGRTLFFWFVEADVHGHSASAPLTLWLNGGPGCSSVGGGMLSELGPFYPTPDGAHLQQNDYSWNKFSHLLFLESPAGVGFSYSNTTSDYVTGDKKTAEDSYNFLVQFFQLYPQYANSRFYIAGESYAGHYVPQLAALVLEQNKAASTKINLKGMMVGNAWTDADIDNYGALFYWWSHALISDATFKGISNECNFSTVGPLRTATDDKCTEYVDDASEQLGSINIYDIYVDVCVSSHAQAETRHFGKQLGRTHFGGVSTRPLLKDAYDPCVADEVETYLNRPEVQVALHANITGLPYQWTHCRLTSLDSPTNGLTAVIL